MTFTWISAAKASAPNLLIGPKNSLHRLLDKTDVTLFQSKYVKGGDEEGDEVPLSFLLEPLNCDAHYTQYTHDSHHRLRKDMTHTGLNFNLMVIDLDAHDQQTTDDDFYHAITNANVCLDYAPNVIIRTKAGMHFWYVISTITNPEEYEAKRMTLANSVKPIHSILPYTVDETKDWTRFFRSPRVLRDDGTDMREAVVWGCHSNILDVRQWKVKETKRKKIKYRPTPMGGLEAAVRYCHKVPGAVSGEGGHNATFKLACKLIREFALNEDEAYDVLECWNQKCDPPWSEQELRHKVTDAMKTMETDDE